MKDFPGAVPEIPVRDMKKAAEMSMRRVRTQSSSP